VVTADFTAVETTDRILDEYLVLASQGGDAEAFAHLVRRWQPRLLRHARRLAGDPETARDAVQEAWLAIARGLARLDDPARFPPWALRIVGRRCADLARRERRAREVEHRGSRNGEALSTGHGPEVGRLREALQRLSAGERTLLSLHYLDRLGIAGIAETLGIPSGTVKSRLFAARRQLRESLERIGT